MTVVLQYEPLFLSFDVPSSWLQRTFVLVAAHLRSGCSAPSRWLQRVHSFFLSFLPYPAGFGK